MEKLFCDECGREIKVSFAGHSITLDDSVTETRTKVSFEIKGEEYYPNEDKHSPNLPMEHLCKKCAIKYIREALEYFKKEYEWDSKDE